jgi:L-ascorbate metabolism protein UlaG (beta-lactamase superfamily)
MDRHIPAGSLIPVTAGDRVQLGTDLSVTAVPAAHETLETDDHGDSVFLGFIIDIAGVRIYHSGDCVPYEGQAQLLREHGVDVALLPINGRDSHRLTNGVPGTSRFRCHQPCTEADTRFGGHRRLQNSTINPDDAVAELTVLREI